MTIIKSRQDLSDFAIRQLGGGVINVELSDDQIEDNIDLAIQFYREYHFDGVERDYLSHVVTATVLTLASAAGLYVGSKLIGQTSGQTANVTAINGNNVSISKQVGKARFAAAEILKDQSNNSYTISSLVQGDLDNEFIPLDETVMGVTKILNLSSIVTGGDFMFNAQYQIMMSEIQNLTSQGFAYLYSTMNYLGNLDFIMKKERDFRFNRRWGKVILDIDWLNDVTVGDYITLEIYRYVDDAVYSQVLNDLWLKKYSTALLKKQWGSNLKKYQGMQLPGGLTYSGQQLYDEAMNDIAKLEDDAIRNGAPLQFVVG